MGKNLMDRRKGLFKKTNQDIHLRSKYMDPSRRFVDWVNSVTFDNVPLGKTLNNLEKRFELRRERHSLHFLHIFNHHHTTHTDHYTQHDQRY